VITDFSELIQSLNAKLEEFQYGSDTEISIPNVQYISYVKEKSFFKVKNLCAMIDMPNDIVDDSKANSFFTVLKKSLLKQYGDAFLWKELEMCFVVLCNNELYKLLESNQGKTMEKVGFSLNALLGTSFVNKVNFNTFATSTWGLHFSGDHFKAVISVVEQWCKDRKQEHQ